MPLLILADRKEDGQPSKWHNLQAISAFISFFCANAAGLSHSLETLWTFPHRLSSILFPKNRENLLKKACGSNLV
jgi:hypothetical protein